MYRNQITPRINFIQLLSYERPDAVAWINGSAEYPRLSGLVKFYQTSYDGILVEAEVFSLPNIDQQGASNFYAIHIWAIVSIAFLRLVLIIALVIIFGCLAYIYLYI